MIEFATTIATAQLSPERISSALLTVNAPPSSKFRSLTCTGSRGVCQAHSWQMKPIDREPRQIAVRKRSTLTAPRLRAALSHNRRQGLHKHRQWQDQSRSLCSCLMSD